MRVRQITLALTLAAALATVGCERRGDAPQDAQDAAAVFPTSKPADAPLYSIAPELVQQYPDVSVFVGDRLKTLVAGDYEGYRRYVSRLREPHSEQQFELIAEAIESVNVTTIEPVELRDMPPPVLRVVAEYKFRPDSKLAQRRTEGKIAILVLRESDEWRMMVAPRALQPKDARRAREGQSGEAATQESDTGPSYPWDKNVDY